MTHEKNKSTPHSANSSRELKLIGKGPFLSDAPQCRDNPTQRAPCFPPRSGGLILINGEIDCGGDTGLLDTYLIFYWLEVCVAVVIPTSRPGRWK